MAGRSSARIAEAIARGLGRRPNAELIRSGANEVYRVDDLVIRIALPDGDVARQAMAVELLAGHDVSIPLLVASGLMDDRPQ